MMHSEGSGRAGYCRAVSVLATLSVLCTALPVIASTGIVAGSPDSKPRIQFQFPPEMEVFGTPVTDALGRAKPDVELRRACIDLYWGNRPSWSTFERAGDVEAQVEEFRTSYASSRFLRNVCANEGPIVWRSDGDGNVSGSGAWPAGFAVFVGHTVDNMQFGPDRILYEPATLEPALGSWMTPAPHLPRAMVLPGDVAVPLSRSGADFCTDDWYNPLMPGGVNSAPVAPLDWEALRRAPRIAGRPINEIDRVDPGRLIEPDEWYLRYGNDPNYVWVGASNPYTPKYELMVACGWYARWHAAFGRSGGMFGPAAFSPDPSLPHLRHVNDTVRGTAIDRKGRTYLAGVFDESGYWFADAPARSSAIGTSGNTVHFDPSLFVQFDPLLGDDRREVRAASGLVRLNEDGTLDASFSPPSLLVPGHRAPEAVLLEHRYNGDVHAYVSVNALELGGASQATMRARVRRLDEWGREDIGFRNAQQSGDVRYTAVHALAHHVGNTLLLGGRMVVESGGNHATALVRLRHDGTRDTSFSPRITGGRVHAIAVQADGRIVIGGSFRQVNGRSVPNLARLHPDGSLDTSFAYQVDGSVWALAVIPPLEGFSAAETIAVGGRFDWLRWRPAGSAGWSQYSPKLALLSPEEQRLHSNRVPVLRYDGAAGVDPRVNALAWDAQAGRLLVGGRFDAVRPRLAANQTEAISRSGMVRLYPEMVATGPGGSLHNRPLRLAVDPGFGDPRIEAPAGQDEVLALAVDPRPLRSQVTRYVPEHRLRGPGGSWMGFDAPFNLERESLERGVPLETRGRVVVAGSFHRAGGETRSRVVRLDRCGQVERLAPAAEAEYLNPSSTPVQARHFLHHTPLWRAPRHDFPLTLHIVDPRPASAEGLIFDSAHGSPRAYVRISSSHYDHLPPTTGHEYWWPKAPHVPISEGLGDTFQGNRDYDSLPRRWRNMHLFFLSAALPYRHANAMLTSVDRMPIDVYCPHELDATWLESVRPRFNPQPPPGTAVRHWDVNPHTGMMQQLQHPEATVPHDAALNPQHSDFHLVPVHTESGGVRLSVWYHDDWEAYLKEYVERVYSTPSAVSGKEALTSFYSSQRDLNSYIEEVRYVLKDGQWRLSGRPGATRPLFANPEDFMQLSEREFARLGRDEKPYDAADYQQVHFNVPRDRVTEAQQMYCDAEGNYCRSCLERARDESPLERWADPYFSPWKEREDCMNPIMYQTITMAMGTVAFMQLGVLVSAAKFAPLVYGATAGKTLFALSKVVYPAYSMLNLGVNLGNAIERTKQGDHLGWIGVGFSLGYLFMGGANTVIASGKMALLEKSGQMATGIATSTALKTVTTPFGLMAFTGWATLQAATNFSISVIQSDGVSYEDLAHWEGVMQMTADIGAPTVLGLVR